jgi:hypothetical protein
MGLRYSLRERKPPAAEEAVDGVRVDAADGVVVTPDPGVVGSDARIRDLVVPGQLPPQARRAGLQVPELLAQLARQPAPVLLGLEPDVAQDGAAPWREDAARLVEDPVGVVDVLQRVEGEHGVHRAAAQRDLGDVAAHRPATLGVELAERGERDVEAHVALGEVRVDAGAAAELDRERVRVQILGEDGQALLAARGRVVRCGAHVGGVGVVAADRSPQRSVHRGPNMSTPGPRVTGRTPGDTPSP